MVIWAAPVSAGAVLVSAATLVAVVPEMSKARNAKPKQTAIFLLGTASLPLNKRAPRHDRAYQNIHRTNTGLATSSLAPGNGAQYLITGANVGFSTASSLGNSFGASSKRISAETNCSSVGLSSRDN